MRYPALCLLLCTFATSMLYAKTQRASVDLNGDGKKEAIVMEYDDVGNFSLKIGNSKVQDSLELIEPFKIIDLDTRDKSQEVMVYTIGPSDDFDTIFYWYDGNRIRKVGRLCECITFAGGGIVSNIQRRDYWDALEKYQLNPKTHVLELVPQELYAVTKTDGNGKKTQFVDCTVTKSFPLYTTRTSGVVLANLREGSTIQILACGPLSAKGKTPADYGGRSWDWFLIKSSTGLLGWARQSVFEKKVTGLPYNLAD